MPKYRDFSEMPDDALRALADDLSNPTAALKRIRAARHGGPTLTEPDLPYCKPDQSCCDFTCGN